jgi:hypothetical protein
MKRQQKRFMLANTTPFTQTTGAGGIVKVYSGFIIDCIRERKITIEQIYW